MRLSIAAHSTLALACLTAACSGASPSPWRFFDGDAAGKGEGEGELPDAPPGFSPRPSGTRRLSKAELENSYRDIIGFSPAALSDVPPDSLGLTFDRIVNVQTVSPAHLDAFAAVARSALDTLLQDATLDDIVPACSDEILPSLAPSVATHVSGATLSAGPDYAVIEPSDPATILLQYAPDPTLSYAHNFAAAGTYSVGLHIDVQDGSADALNIAVNGVAVAGLGAVVGEQTYTATIDVDAGPAVFDYTMVGNDNNFTLVVTELVITGPVDPGAGFAAERTACATAIVDTLGPLAFRRALASEERARLVALIDLAGGDAAEAMRMVFEAIFANPSFLYLIEIGEPDEQVDGLFALTATERAARLSYALCESPPDTELKAAVANDQLSTLTDIQTQVDRLLASPCGQRTVTRFFEQWLWLNRVPDQARDGVLFPEFTPEVRAGMLVETQRFIRELIYNENAKLEDFFTSDVSWPDPNSAFIYGLNNVNSQVRTTLPAERQGILTQPSVLTATSLFDSTSPVRRGVYVLHQLLCQELAPPPPSLSVVPPAPDPNATTRERWAQHSADASCASCHTAIDPIGFALEGFDPIGRYRTVENGRPVDTTGGVPALGVEDGALVGAKALSQAIATSPELTQCFARQWLRFTLGRMDTDADADSLAVVNAALANGDLKSALASITTTLAFVTRAEEVTP